VHTPSKQGKPVAFIAQQQGYRTIIKQGSSWINCEMSGRAALPTHRWVDLGCLLAVAATLLLSFSSDIPSSLLSSSLKTTRALQSTNREDVLHIDVENENDYTAIPNHRRLADVVPKQILKSFNAARSKVYDKLRKDYGSENFDNIFFVTSKLDNKTLVPRPTIVGPSEEATSRRRLINKVLLKIFRAKAADQNVPFVWAVSI
jgi:hypothetical protein